MVYAIVETTVKSTATLLPPVGSHNLNCKSWFASKLVDPLILALVFEYITFGFIVVK